MANYHKLSIQQKQAAHRNRMRPPPIRCLDCGAQTTEADLLRHVSTTCPGRPAPHPLSKWLSHAEVLELGVLRGTLSKWVRRRLVRVRGDDGRRQYLQVDVVRLIAERKRGAVSKRKLDGDSAAVIGVKK